MIRLWQRLLAWWRGRREPKPISLTTKPPVIGAPTMMINRPEPKNKRGKKRP